jgi:pimeloyl-ACP methyl ester carboxylesterase
MHEHLSCEQTCGSGACSALAAQGPVILADALARFEREATSGSCDTGRYRLEYSAWGSGPPLIFVHGASDTRRSFVMVMSRLSAHFRCVAYDLPSGHGDGARLGRYRHDDLAADLWSLLDHLGHERAYLYGSSFGSTIVLRAMRQRPERVPRAILQGGLAYRPLRRAERVATWLFRWLPGPTGRLPRRERLLELVHKEPFAGRPEEVWRAYVEWTGQVRLKALGHQARLLDGVDLRADLPHIRQPVLVVHGDRDAVIRRPHADMLLGGLPSAGLVVLEGAGHVPYYTHPEALAAVIGRFLTPPGQGCPAHAESCSAGGALRDEGRCG